MGARSTYNLDSQGVELDFQRLVDLHYAPLYRFAMSLTRTENDAADLVQDTFLIWAKKGHQLLDISKVKSWLFTTLHRRFLEGRRRSQRFPHLEISEAEADLPNIDPDTLNRLDGRILVNLIGELDEQFQAAISLFYLEDYSYVQIAEILEVPLGTVKSRISRGIAQLKNLVREKVPNQASTEEQTA